jgi:TonB family protein
MRAHLLLLLSLFATACATDSAKYQVIGFAETPSATSATQQHAERVSEITSKANLDSSLRVLRSVFPDYPVSLRQVGIKGGVRVEFNIEPDGTVADPLVIGSPPPALAALSVYAIAQWKFSPPMRNGSPVRLRAVQQFDFQLR